jgi:IS4 transposase
VIDLELDLAQDGKMRLFSPVFAQVMSVLHPQAFARRVAAYPLRRQPRGLSVYDHFLALCFAHLTSRESLRDLEACLNARPSLLYHLGFRGRVTRANLAYANTHRSWRLFASVAQLLMRQARRLYAGEQQDPALPESAFALDASLIHLSARLFPWAIGGRRNATAVKLHTLLALRGPLPAWAALTRGEFCDAQMLDHVPVQPGCVYVLDRGYENFVRLRRLVQHRAYFVVRSRRDLSFRVLGSAPVDKTTGLRCDQKIELTHPKSYRVYREPLRRVRIYDAEHKRSLAFLTNHFGLPSQSVADLYKRRWQVELFFRWIKQHLCLRGFLGVSPNAAQCQIWSAPCVYLLVAILKKELQLTQSPHEILQILSIHPFEQSPIQELLMKTELENPATAQQNLFDPNTL